MSYVYMKALESSPERYDKGIQWLGWGNLDKIRNRIAELAESNGQDVLEIGVGTGTQAMLFAERGLNVVGFDKSAEMLSIAKLKLDKRRNEDVEAREVVSRIKLLQKSAAEIDEFSGESFDVVTSTLVFSELFPYERRYVLANAFRVLRPGGALILADEVVPRKRINRLAYGIVSLPLKLITYLVTQTSTKPLHDMSERIEEAGFAVEQTVEYQLGAFKVVVARKPQAVVSSDTSFSEPKSDTLSPPAGGVLSTLWQTATRMFAHPTDIGLIAVGNPTRNSPVLCTCNFKLTVQRLCQLLKRKCINAWVLVSPTGGDNVWCASAAGKFNAESVITAIKVSHLDKYVSHRQIILPQLAAPGVNPHRIAQATGWHCIWGPVRMDDLPDYLESFPDIVGKKTERQRTVAFDARNRIEMALVILFPMLMFLGGPLFLFLIILNLWGWILPLLLESVFYYLGIFLLWPKIPARIGPKKVVIYSTVFMFALLLGSWVSTQFIESAFSSAFLFSDVLAALNWWPLQVFMMVLAVMLWYDADGSTPTQRSTLLANAWNRGKTKVLERWGSHVSPTQYGIITARVELCTGCGDCVDVCPMLIPEVEIESTKVRLRNPDYCINCRACINQCPTNTLFLAPETEAAKLALERLQNK
jgi:ubiquinone/menaquinone biosynthesis C-methylase UbiE/ferredoxin